MRLQTSIIGSCIFWLCTGCGGSGGGGGTTPEEPVVSVTTERVELNGVMPSLDAGTVAEIRVNGTPATITGTNWSVDVDLAAAANEYIVDLYVDGVLQPGSHVIAMDK